MTDVRREGFSLMEVILAMSILLGGVIVLGRLAAIGIKHARDAEDLSTAQLLCETRMNEILSGIIPPEEVREEPLDETSGWVVSTELRPLERPGVVALHVTVGRASISTSSTVFEPESAEKQVSVSLVRWIPDPAAASQSGSEIPAITSQGEDSAL